MQTTFHGNLGVTQEAGAPPRPFLKACSHPYPAPFLVGLDNSLRSGMETLLDLSDSVRTTLPGRQCAVRHLYWANGDSGGGTSALRSATGRAFRRWPPATSCKLGSVAVGSFGLLGGPEVTGRQTCCAGCSEHQRSCRRG